MDELTDKMTDKVKVGVISGGACEEHPISVKSARQVAKNLDLGTYEPYWIRIAPDGAWTLCDGPGAGLDGAPGRPAILSPDRSVHGLLVREPGGYAPVRLDVVLPVLHGRLGEDGAIQGLLDLAGIPYVGCGVQSSAVCMDKSLAYTVARSAGIATPEFRVVAPEETVDPGGLRYPVFVKPARSGSSFGVTKVTRADDLPEALEDARQYDAKVLIEQAVAGREIGCALMGDGRDLVVGEVDHVALSHGFFRIHQENAPETGSENAVFVVPADIPATARDLVRATAESVYRALGCTGLARVDLFLTDDGRAVLNEVNTLPGLTSYSRYPRMMAAAGLPMREVLDRLITTALHGTIR